jgi:hypothetical protein
MTAADPCRLASVVADCRRTAADWGHGAGDKDQQVRDRQWEYQAQLDAAGESVAVLARFAQAREARGNDVALEVRFAATPVEPDGAALPASAWVALRQDDIDAVLDTLVQHATEQFLLAEHEQVDASYRLTTVAECRGLPAVDTLIAQLGAFLEVPRDVVAMVSTWGPHDPRTLAEIERLIHQRYGQRSAATQAPTTPAHSVSAKSPRSSRGTVSAPTNRPTLAMSSSELTAMLSLTPDQQIVLSTLVRRADIVVAADAATAAID